MADKKIRISDLPESSSTGGLFTLGVNSLNGSVKVPLGSIVDGISQQADRAESRANEAATNAASAKTKAEEAASKAETAFTTANNAETRNDSQDAAIETLQTDVEALKAGGSSGSGDSTVSWAIDLGESDNAGAGNMPDKAPTEAAAPQYAGDKNLRRILFTVTDGSKTYGAFIDQNVFDTSCVQVMHLNGRRFCRYIYFTDSTRAEVREKQGWQLTDVRNVYYEKTTDTIKLKNMWGQLVGDTNVQINVADDKYNGLMPKGTMTTIAKLQSDVAALQSGGSGSGGGTDYSGEIAALNTAVEGHTSAISSIQQKDTEQDDAISSLQSKETTQDSDIEALSAKSEELEAGITSMQADVSEHGSDIGKMKQDIASLKTVTEPQTVDASALDSLCPSVEAAKSLIQHAEKMRYIVTVTKGGISICVGELIMYADSGALQVTQELRSHYLITGNNVSSDSVRLDAANTYCRSFGVLSNDHSATGSWTEWKPKGGVLDIGISDINSNSAIRMNVPTLLQDASVCGNLYVSRVLFTIKLDSNGNTYSGTADQIVSGSQCVQRMQLNGRIFTRSINFSDAARGTVSFVQPWQDSEARNLSYNKSTGAIGMANMWGDAVGVSATIPVSDDDYMGLVPAGTLSTLDYRLADVLAILYSLSGSNYGTFAGFAPDNCVVQDSTVEIDPIKLSQLLFWRNAENKSESGWVVKSGNSYFKRWTPSSSFNETNQIAVAYCSSDGCYYVIHNNSIRKLSVDTGADMYNFAFIASFFMKFITASPGIGNFNNLDNPLSIGINDDHFIIRHFESLDYSTGNRPKTAISFTTSDGKYLYQYLFAQGTIKIRTIEYTTEDRKTISSVGQWRTL